MKMNKVRCEFCGKEIPPERLEILPDTSTCVQCSQIKHYSEEEVLGLNSSETQEQNQLNIEDFEENDEDTSLSLRDIF